MPTHLQKITTRAKHLKKSHPQTKWTNLVKMAAKELKAGKAKVSGTKKVHHKKSQAMATKKRAGSKTIVVAGHKKHATKKRSKSRVSGIHTKMGLWGVAKVLGGSILGGGVGAIIQRNAPGSQVVKSLITLGAGGGGMMMVGSAHPFWFGVANGVGTAGGVNLLHTTGAIHGVEEMVSGIFDGMGGNGYVQGVYQDDKKIPENTAGNNNREGLNQGGYVGTYTSQDIDAWVREGIPGVGGDDRQWM